MRLQQGKGVTNENNFKAAAALNPIATFVTTQKTLDGQQKHPSVVITRGAFKTVFHNQLVQV